MKKKKIRWDNCIVLLMMIIIIIAFICIVVDTIKWNMDNHNLKKQINYIEDIVDKKEINDREDTEIIQPETQLDNKNPYFDYIKMNMIDVDFKELKKVNQDVKGWITVNGTNVNYPFVQTSDNKYYLTHSFDQSYNEAGWVFLDYRNNLLMNKNTILYAHRRNDKTMFGSLKDILSNGWLNNTNNHVIKLSTESENTLWQIFSIYHIKTTSDYLKTEFKDDDEFLTFVTMLQERSMHHFDTTVSKSDQILTLSTCYNSKEKLVIHAKLIKKTPK